MSPDGAPSPLRVSATMIVRNECAHLAACLASLRGRVDEIVVVDTGSIDDSVAIALDGGARVVSHRWTGDFSTARNLALDHANGDWALYIDADERLRPEGPTRIANCIDVEAAACSVRFRPRSGFTRYREWRLFPLRPDIRFSGVFHETMLPAVRQIAAAENRRRSPVPLAIDHLGYDGDMSHKHARNLPLLRQAHAQSPHRVYIVQHLAETLAALGQWAEAEALASRTLQHAAPDGPEDHRAALSLLRQFMARALARRRADPTQLINEGLAQNPDDHALRLLHAQAALAQGAPERCLEILAILTAIDPEQLDGCLAFDVSIFGARADALQAAAYWRLGDRHKAAAILQRLTSRTPGGD